MDIKDLIVKEQKEKAEKIINCIDSYFDVNVKEHTRRKDVLIPRQMAMYYIKTNLKLSLAQVGRLFPYMKKGEKKYLDHATVLHARNTIDGYLEFDYEVKNYHSELNPKITSIVKYNSKQLKKHKCIDEILDKLINSDYEEVKKINEILSV